jgi:flavin reductase (DIM6/NTAB) family NADH-FMN oxidoreductase RutF
MSQGGYSVLMGTGFAGEVVDTRTQVTESQLVEDTSLAFGLGVVAGANANGVKLSSSGSDVFRGIVAHRHKEQSYPFTASSAAYLQNEIANVLRRGLIWVVVGAAVAVDADAYVITDGSGQFTSSSSSNIATGGKFRTAQATVGGLAQVEINLP